MTITIFLSALLGAMALGVPIAFSLLACGVALMWHMDMFDAQILAQNTIEGANSFPLLAVPFFMLAGEVIRGRATFEWLDGGRFLIWRSHYDHPQLPDAISVTGVIDGQLSMQYFDTLGVHRVYAVSTSPGTWRFWRDDADFAQRSTSRFDADTIETEGQLFRDGTTWEEDLRLSYRRIG